MKPVLIMLSLLIAASILTAQPAPQTPAPQDEVITAQSAPSPTIRVVYKEKGKVKDGGRYVKVELYERVVAANQKMGQFIEQLSLAGIQIIDPGLYTVLTDSNYIYLRKDQIRTSPPPAPAPVSPTPTPTPAPEPKK